MPGAAVFQDVLDRTLGAARVQSSPPAVAAWVGTAASYGFLSLDSGGSTICADIPVREDWCGRRAARTAEPMPRRTGDRLFGAPPRSDGPMPSGSRKTVQRRFALTPDQRLALEELRALGAPLDAGFSEDELRQVFRALARRFHPDRHPGAGELAKADLSTLFRRVRHAYTVLLTAGF